MPRAKDPKLEEQRRVHIMTTVYLCLAQDSHRSLTLDGVAKLAGVSKGMVTYYFKSKDRLIVSAIQHFLATHLERLLSIVREDRPVRERLERLLEAALPSREEVQLELSFQTEVWSYAKAQPDALEAIHGAYLSFREACSEMVLVGVEEGYVSAKEGNWVYLLLHALIDGISFQVVLDPTLDLDEVRGRILRLIDVLVTT